MGLDMFLKAKKSLLFNSDVSGKVSELFPELSGIEPTFGDSVISEITADVGYWRKANHIHHWFVKNVQDDKDDCGEYYCSRKKMQELLDLCMELLTAKHSEIKLQIPSEEWQLLMPNEIVPSNTTETADSMAESLLPTSSGFFFGSTDYDEWYWRNIFSTAAILKKCLALPSDWSFYYHSSW